MTEQLDIHIHFSDGAIMGLDYFEAVLKSPFSDAGIKTVFELTKPNLLYQLNSSSFFSLKIKAKYYSDFIEKDNDVLFDLLLTNLRPLDPLLKGKEPGKTPADYGFEKMAVFYEGIKEGQMFFRYPAGLTDEDEKAAWDAMISIIRAHESGDEKQTEWLQSVMVQKDNLRYFQLDQQTWSWNLLDPLEKVTLSLSEDYFKSTGDPRVRKPYIIINEDHFNQHFIWDKQWELNHEGNRVIIPRPNEIALYISLSDKSAANAMVVYNAEKKKRDRPFYNPLLRKKEAAVFYDYFEEVIAAVIFSYTAIETMANSCIVESYRYSTENKGVTKTYSKEAIERNFSLRDKLKVILRDILKTTDPTKEKWWQRFIDLEEIRNGLIHFKQQESIDLYSSLLEKKTFALIEVSKEIIQFYGSYVMQNGKEVLNDLPYGFGCNNVRPYFMSDKDYRHEWRSMRGIPDPEEKKDEEQ